MLLSSTTSTGTIWYPCPLPTTRLFPFVTHFSLTMIPVEIFALLHGCQESLTHFLFMSTCMFANHNQNYFKFIMTCTFPFSMRCQYSILHAHSFHSKLSTCQLSHIYPFTKRNVYCILEIRSCITLTKMDKDSSSITAMQSPCKKNCKRMTELKGITIFSFFLSFLLHNVKNPC